MFFRRGRGRYPPKKDRRTLRFGRSRKINACHDVSHDHHRDHDAHHDHDHAPGLTIIIIMAFGYDSQIYEITIHFDHG